MKRKKILMVDDDEDFREAYRIFLETKYEVVTAGSGEEGWKKLEEETPDLLILDVMMDNRGEGFIFSRKMKKDDRFSHIPIIMLTGMREQTGFYFVRDDPRDSKFLPVDEFLEKPVDHMVLMEKVEELLHRKPNNNPQDT